MNKPSNLLTQKTVDWMFWFGWLALSTIGSLLGIMAGIFVSLLTGGWGSKGFPLGWTVVWAVLGFFQWLLLKRLIKRASLWIAASALGGAIALPVSVLVSYSASTNALSDFFGDFIISLDLSSWYELFNLSKIGAINGAIVGFAQWLLLRKISRSGWWIAASALGGAMILPPISAAITGFALVLMLSVETSKPDSYIEE